jgi:hypothetical protein
LRHVLQPEAELNRIGKSSGAESRTSFSTDDDLGSFVSAIAPKRQAHPHDITTTVARHPGEVETDDMAAILTQSINLATGFHGDSNGWQ